MAILHGYGFDKENNKVKRLDYDNPQPKGIKVITIKEKEQTQKQSQYIKIKLCTGNYCSCENEIREIQRSIEKYLSGIEKLVQIGKVLPDINISSFVAAQKRNFEDIIKVSMTMTDALIKEYGIDKQEEIEDLRNIILELSGKAEDIRK